MKKKSARTRSSEPARWVKGECLCGAVEIEIGYPARWAFHDHCEASRRAHGAAYATYLGCWKSRFRIAKGEENVGCYEDAKAGRVRRFCRQCGTPVAYERAHSPQMVNTPRALFAGRTGREPLYHTSIDELADWTYLGERLSPLKGFPGVFWTRAKPKKREIF